MAGVFELAQRYEACALDYARALGQNARGEGVTLKRCGILRGQKTRAYNAWRGALFTQAMLKHNGGSMA